MQRVKAGPAVAPTARASLAAPQTRFWPQRRAIAAPSPTAGAAVSPLDALPDEVKLLVLQHTGHNPFTLARMQQVNRCWRRVAQDDCLWEPLYPRHLWPQQQAHDKPHRMPGPQARFAAHMHKAKALRHLFFRELWWGYAQNVTLVAGSSDPIFACHAFLKIGPDWARNLRWRAHLSDGRLHLREEAAWLQMAEFAASLGVLP